MQWYKRIMRDKTYLSVVIVVAGINMPGRQVSTWKGGDFMMMASGC